MIQILDVIPPVWHGQKCAAQIVRMRNRLTKFSGKFELENMLVSNFALNLQFPGAHALGLKCTLRSLPMCALAGSV